jgi:hypothetical protein
MQRAFAAGMTCMRERYDPIGGARVRRDAPGIPKIKKELQETP